jgi:hypothetical protein
VNPEAGQIWKENCALAQVLADEWKKQALEMRSQRDQWELVANRRVRAGFCYAIAYFCLVLGFVAGFFLSRSTDRMPGANGPRGTNVGETEGGRR